MILGLLLASALLSSPARAGCTKNERLNSALQDAAFAGDLDQVERLLAKGADPRGGTRNGTAALGWSRDADVLAAMLRVSTPDSAPLHGCARQPGDPNGRPLQVAAALCFPETVAALLDAGVDVDLQGMRAHHGTPLARALADRAPRPDRSPYAGRDPACLTTARLLLDRGASPDVWVERREPDPLLMAVTRLKDLEAVQLLLDAGADPDVIGPEARTALHLAAEAGADDIVIALLDAGAAPDLIDVYGKTPLDVGRLRVQPATRERLASKPLDPVLAEAARSGDIAVLVTAREQDRISWTARSEPEGLPLLHLLFDHGQEELVQGFLGVGAPATARSSAGDDLFVHVLRRGRLDFAAWMLKGPFGEPLGQLDDAVALARTSEDPALTAFVVEHGHKPRFDRTGAASPPYTLAAMQAGRDLVSADVTVDPLFTAMVWLFGNDARLPPWEWNVQSEVFVPQGYPAGFLSTLGALGEALLGGGPSAVRAAAPGAYGTFLADLDEADRRWLGEVIEVQLAMLELAPVLPPETVTVQGTTTSTQDRFYRDSSMAGVDGSVVVTTGVEQVEVTHRTFDQVTVGGLTGAEAEAMAQHQGRLRALLGRRPKLR